MKITCNQKQGCQGHLKGIHVLRSFYEDNFYESSSNYKNCLNNFVLLAICFSLCLLFYLERKVYVGGGDIQIYEMGVGNGQCAL